MLKIRVFILNFMNKQSTLDIVTLDLREIRYRGQIFVAPAVPMET